MNQDVLEEKSLEMDSKKVKVIVNQLKPNTMIKIKSLLGLAGYYRKFIQNFPRVVAPRTGLAKENQKLYGCLV